MLRLALPLALAVAPAACTSSTSTLAHATDASAPIPVDAHERPSPFTPGGDAESACTGEAIGAPCATVGLSCTTDGGCETWSCSQEGTWIVHLLCEPVADAGLPPPGSVDADGIHDAVADQQVESGCVDLVVGARCAPLELTCQVGCATWFCYGQWKEAPSCVDGGKPVADAARD